MMLPSRFGFFVCNSLLLQPLLWSSRRTTTTRAFSVLPLCSSSSATRKSYTSRMMSKDSEDKLISLQKGKSGNLIKEDDDDEPALFSSEKEHLEHQQQLFDDMATFFQSDEAVPPEIVPILEIMTSRILQQAQMQRRLGMERRNVTQEPPEEVYRVLDAACGTGALFPFFLNAADEMNMILNITGVDLSANMVQHAQQTARQLKEQHPHHNIQVVQSDILQFVGSDDTFDIITANACFGNFWDQSAVLQHFAKLLHVDGCLFLTHPLGSDFVQKLHQQDAKSVPHLLPNQNKLEQMIRCLPLEMIDFCETVSLTQDDDATVPMYCAGSVRVRHRALEQVMRLRGPVANGYGRGGKKLGFPTANLPSSLFQTALQDVPTGVYLGWAVIEDADGTKKGRNVQHKAVVNVGYSPTFEGQENREKIVEAHLMVDDETSSSLDPPDFYNETMRLQLDGFMRPEIKFPSFPDLVKQITADVTDTRDALDLSPYRELRLDSFLVDTVLHDGDVWVGSDGGDKMASWEFQDIETSLQEVPPYRNA